MVDSSKMMAGISAYKNALSMASGLPSTNATVGEVKPDFMEMVGQSLNNAIDSQYKAEETATNAVMNKTSIDDLVLAVNSADLSLRTIISLRDRVISAYQEIIKMPI